MRYSQMVPITAAMSLVLSLATLSAPEAGAAQHGGNAQCVAVNGGTVVNETVLDVVADGGTAIGDASGGQGNLATGSGNGNNGNGNHKNRNNNNNNGNNNNNNNNNRNNNRRDWSAVPMQTSLDVLFQQDTASAGNAGVATSAANGGVVSIGDVNSGGNAGNAVAIGDTVCPGAVPVQAGGGNKGGGNAGGGQGGQGGQVTQLPKTGISVVDADTTGSLALALGALGMAALAFGFRDDRRFFRDQVR